MSWYNDVKEFEIPSFISHLKKLVEKKGRLLVVRNEINKRIKKGVDFFQTNENPDLVKKASQDFYELALSIKDTNQRIVDIDVEIISTMEAKLGEIGFIINRPRGENSLGEIRHAEKIYCLPWRSAGNDDLIKITPDDAWFLRMVKSIFGHNPDNIEFLKDEFFKEE